MLQEVQKTAKNILVIEDDVSFLNAVSSWVQTVDPDISVYKSKSLVEAEGFLRKNKMDLIISDYDLGINKATELINDASVHCPVIFLTGNGTVQVIKELANNHPFHILEKGLFKMDHFTKIVKEALVENDRVKKAHNLTLVGEKTAERIHEINNPLTIISGKVFAVRAKLQKRYGVLPDDPILKDLEAIETSVKRAGDLMRMTKEEVNKKDHLEMTRIPVRKFLQNFFQDNQEFLEKEQVEVFYDLEDDFQILADQNKLYQVFSNLLNNSVDEFNEKKVKDRMITIGTRKYEDSVEIFFEDNGGGIPYSIRPKVMEKLFTTKEGSKGTGFGLAICKAIVEEHKGEFKLAENTEKARFLVKLKAS